MAILLVQLVTRSQRRSSAGISNTIALRKLGTRNCPCLNRFLSLKAPPLAAGIFYFSALLAPVTVLLHGAKSWQLRAIPKHPEAHLWPSEVVTLGLLHALKGGGTRPF